MTGGARRGADRRPVAITGIAPITAIGFDLPRTMAEKGNGPSAASRPLEVRRSGFVLEEGAGVAALSNSFAFGGHHATLVMTAS